MSKSKVWHPRVNGGTDGKIIIHITPNTNCLTGTWKLKSGNTVSIREGKQSTIVRKILKYFSKVKNKFYVAQQLKEYHFFQMATFKKEE